MTRILVIPPHPDDEVLGCGGSIAAHVAAGSDVTIAHLTSGERGTTTSATVSGRNREREAVTAATVLGVPDRAVRFLRIPDGGINPFDPDQLTAVITVLREVRPELLYVPHPHDGAFDHEAASTLCLRAAAMAGSRNFPGCGPPHWVGTILGFEVWSPISAPVYLRDVGPFLDRKIAALGCYASQAAGAKGADQSTLVGPACAHLSGFRGATTTGGHREAFAVLRVAELPA